MTTKAQQICLDAAKLIEEKGWCRRAFSTHGRYCALGALHIAGRGKPLSLRMRASDLLRLQVHGNTLDSISEWNDSRKSRAPVIRALRYAGGAAE